MNPQKIPKRNGRLRPGLESLRIVGWIQSQIRRATPLTRIGCRPVHSSRPPNTNSSAFIRIQSALKTANDWLLQLSAPPADATANPMAEYPAIRPAK